MYQLKMLATVQRSALSYWPSVAYFLELTEEDALYWSRELSFANTNSRIFLGWEGAFLGVSDVFKIKIINLEEHVNHFIILPYKNTSWIYKDKILYFIETRLIVMYWNSFSIAREEGKKMLNIYWAFIV